MSQQRAVDRVSHTLMQAQRNCADLLFRGDTALEPLPLHDRCIKGITVEWDETSQKVIPAKTRKRVSKSAVSTQTMMSSGEMFDLDFHTGAERSCSEEPWFARGKRLIDTTANGLLAGLLREWPFDFEDVSFWTKTLSTCSVFLFLACSDRAAPNFSLLRWMWDFFFQHFHFTVFPHMEPCMAHGWSLIKGRIKAFERIAAAIHSFSRLMKIDKNLESFCNALTEVVAASLRRSFEARPFHLAERSNSLLRALLVHGDDSHMYHTGKDGIRRGTSRLADLHAIVDQVDLFDIGEDVRVAPGDVPVYHWCYVTEDSDDHVLRGKPVGSPCCDSVDESVLKVVEPYHDWCSARAWDNCCESRWTQVVPTSNAL